MLGRQTLDLQAYSSRKWLEKAKVSGCGGFYWLTFANVLQMISSGKNWGVSGRDWDVEGSSVIKGPPELAKLLFLVLKEWEIRFKMVLRDKYPLTFLNWTESALKQSWNKDATALSVPTDCQKISRSQTLSWESIGHNGRGAVYEKKKQIWELSLGENFGSWLTHDTDRNEIDKKPTCF